jgi:putative ABC transport system substrate-binding protein
MRRREFIRQFSSTIVAWPLTARAQQAVMPVIGFLNGQTAGSFQHLVAAFQRGLNEAGFVEGQNVAIDYRWADGRVDRLRALANELVRRRVAVIVAAGGAALAAKVATITIPIIAAFGGEPVKLGFVDSLNRPGGNITGVSAFTVELAAKSLELLHELIPRATSVGLLLNPNESAVDLQRRAVETAARTIGLKVLIAEVSADSELEGAFATLAESHVAGLVVTSGPLFNNIRGHILALTARFALPSIYGEREFTMSGGLMSYGKTSRMSTARSDSTPAECSRVKSRPTCLFYNLQNSTRLSI